MYVMELKIKKIYKDAKVPAYAHLGDAGFDLYAIDEVAIPPGKHVLIATGIAFEIPEGYAGLIWDKSGLATTHGLKTLGGVVDAGYRGEVKVGVINLSAKEYVIGVGNKVAQMLIQKAERVDIKEVAELSGSSRGEGGFGSTGK